MKYIDADRLRAEIEKKRNEIVAKALDPDACIERIASAKYKKDALSDVISIIDSLPQEMELPEKYQTPDWLFEEQEQAEVDLEKELDRWRHAHFNGKRDGDYSGEYLERKSQIDIARHFAEWGAIHLNARKEK